MSNGAQSKISVTELAQKLGKKGVQPGTFLQRAGVKLFGWTLIFTVGVLIFLASYVLAGSWGMPSTDSTNPAVDTLALRLVAEQRASTWAAFLDGVDKLVIGVCFPLLTAILGYIFGTGQGTSSENLQG